jgi:hypothetical protein
VSYVKSRSIPRNRRKTSGLESRPIRPLLLDRPPYERLDDRVTGLAVIAQAAAPLRPVVVAW